MIQDRDLLRRTLRQRRRELPPAERMSAAEGLARQLLELPFAPIDGPVGGYWAMDGEIALHAWQLSLPPTVTYCLPVLHEKKCLRFAPWRPGQPLVSNRYGIPEPEVPPSQLLLPEAMRLVALPLVGFDTGGRRLGMGAGWYDRSFASRRDAPAPPWLVGAGFGLQEVEALEAAPWDVPMDAICTESTTHLAPGTAVA